MLMVPLAHGGSLDRNRAKEGVCLGHLCPSSVPIDRTVVLFRSWGRRYIE